MEAALQAIMAAVAGPVVVAVVEAVAPVAEAAGAEDKVFKV